MPSSIPWLFGYIGYHRSFIQICSLSAPKLVNVFIKEIMSIHGLPQTIVSDRDKVFTSKFWKQICNRQVIKLARSSAYYPQ